MFQIKVGVALVALAYAGLALADDLPEFNGDDVVVTASGVPQAKGIAPVSVSVITAKDIANSSVSTVQDVLATAGGVHVFNAGGSSPVVDLGGFGQTGFSNTLILVDGVKQNTNDLSAPDLGYIPLAGIERIEIVRRSGSVQYGDGATGGVINIITKSGYRAENHASITQTLGSFNLRQTDASFNLAGEHLSLDGFAQSMNNDHFRDNSAERRDGGGLGLNWKLDDGAVRLYARSSSDSQGLAGGRRVFTQSGISQFDSNPSGTSSPYNHSNVKINVAGLQADHKLGSGHLYLDLSTRDKTTISQWAAEPTTRDRRLLNEDSGSVRYVLPFARANQWLFGYDWLSGDASNSSSWSSSSSKQRHQAVFTEGQLDLWSGARATIGGRIQRIDDHAFGSSVDVNRDQELHAWQLGLRQALGSAWSVYAKQGQSFRLPNSDDFGSTTSAGLLPQTSRDQELGVEWSQGSSNAHLALFRSDLTNEIHYLPFVTGANGWPGANINLSPTRHQGVEFEGKAALNSALSLFGNLTWQQATFRSGRYSGVDLSGKSIPMVPSWLANLGLSWAATEQTRVNLEMQYVGEQHLDNDQRNQYVAKLAAYTVVNTKLTHQFNKSVSGTFSINNLLDRHYATYGIGYTGAYDLYPGDPRNYQASLSWAF